MKKFAVTGALLLTACFQDDRDRKATSGENVVRHYQMLPGPEGTVYILDTEEGRIRNCRPDGDKKRMFCSAAA